MRISRRLFLSVALIVPSVFGIAQTQKGVRSIRPDEARTLMTSRKPLLILDVRTAAEFREGHLVGARNLDVTLPTFQQSLEKLDTSKPVLVYCAVGGRSAKASKILENRGFRVLDLAGGYRAWTQLRYPVQQ